MLKWYWISVVIRRNSILLPPGWQKCRSLTVSSVGKDKGGKEWSYTTGRSDLGMTIARSNLEFSKIAGIMWYCSSVFGCVSPKRVYMYVQGGCSFLVAAFIFSSRKLETTEMSIRRRMDEWYVKYMTLERARKFNVEFLKIRWQSCMQSVIPNV